MNPNDDPRLPDAPESVECPDCDEHITKGGNHHPQCPLVGFDAGKVREICRRRGAEDRRHTQVEEYLLFRGEHDE